MKPIADRPNAPHPAAACPAPARPTLVEAWLVVALVVVAAAARCAFPAGMAVEHFDEGVYASNIWFDADDGFRYPAQHLYAPPLLPALIEWVALLFGPSNFGAILPSLVAGCLTIPLVWWVGRAWFGPAAGVASATLAAFSDVHIALSRTALTDVLLGLWMLLAVYFVWRALLNGGRWPIVAAGLFTALAWWTKYNGWLPLAIGGAGLAPWWFLSRWGQAATGEGVAGGSFSDEPIEPVGRPRHSPGRASKSSMPAPAPAAPDQIPSASLVRWIAIWAIAFAGWSGWLWSLQAVGGYSAVAANHRGYLVGLTGWLESCQTQISNLNQLEGTFGQHAPIAAFLAAAYCLTGVSRRFTWNALAGTFDAWLAAGLLLALSALLGGWILTGVIGAFGLPVALVVVRRIELPVRRRRVGLAAWMLAAWFVGLALTTPMYTPFPRLALPWVMASWLAGGLGLYLFVSFLGQVAIGEQASATGFFRRALLQRTDSPVPRGMLLFGVAGCGLVALFGLETRVFRQGCPAWESRTTARDGAGKLLEACRASVSERRSPSEPFVIYTLAEPALLFQLRLAGAQYVRPVASLALAHRDAPAADVPSFVVFGEQARRTRGFEADFDAARDRLGEIGSTCLDPSLIVRLDSRSTAPALPDRPDSPGACPDRIALYRIR